MRSCLVWALTHYSAAQTESSGSRFLATMGTTHMGDGCRYIFLDVGTNRGVHIRSLMEPTLFPEALYVKEEFWVQYFGREYENDSSVCAFGFEPNAAHHSRLERLAQHYRSAGKRVEMMYVATKSKPGMMTMYDHRGDELKSHWRFGSFRKSYHPVNVTAIDLALWIKHEVLSRRIPPKANGNAPRPAVLMKLDVEGDELELLQRMLDLDVLCHIDLITWEYHDYLLPPLEKRYATHKALWNLIFEHQSSTDEDESSSARHLAIRNERASYPQDAATVRRKCRTRFIAKDDEGYLMVPDVPLRSWEPFVLKS